MLFEFSPDSNAGAVHDREVFGPVASLLPYSENPAAIVARGSGGLVCSVYSEDSAWLEDMAMVRGGPRRAGGGDELGGRRSLAFYLQRVALEGSRPVIQGLIKEGSTG